MRWAEQKDRPPLCTDRQARLLVDALLPVQEKASLLSSAQCDLEAQVAAVHCAFIDRLVLDAIGRRIRQVVLVGSGMDSRAYRLDVPPQLKIVEVDEADVHGAKADTLEHAGQRARCMVHRVVADAELVNAGKIPAVLGDGALNAQRPSLFIVDGMLTASWSAEARLAALKSLAGVAADGSRLLLQVRGPLLQSASGGGDNATDGVMEAGWARVDLVGQRILRGLYPGEMPPDEAAVLVVAEKGAPASPARPPPATRRTESPRAAPAGQPREAKW